MTKTTQRPPRSSPEEIAEDLAAWKQEMAERWGSENAWQEYAGDSFGEQYAYIGDKEMKRRKRLIAADIDPYTGGPLLLD